MRDKPSPGAPRQALSATARFVERVLLAVVALAVIVLGFFFLAAAVVAGAILAAAVLVRLWWLQRSIRKREQDRYLSAEYTVVEREEPARDEPRLPPDR